MNLTRYPTQFVRLKKSQWERVKYQWMSGEEIPEWEHIDNQDEMQEPKKRISLFKKLIKKHSF